MAVRATHGVNDVHEKKNISFTTFQEILLVHTFGGEEMKKFCQLASIPSVFAE